MVIAEDRELLTADFDEERRGLFIGRGGWSIFRPDLIKGNHRALRRGTEITEYFLNKDGKISWNMVIAEDRELLTAGFAEEGGG